MTRHVTTQYAFLLDRIWAAIEDGQLEAGDPLPSKRELALRYNVGVETARRVVAELRDLGLVETRPGVGTVVAGGRSPGRPNPIAEDLTRRIDSGELQPGDRVPSTRQLADQWKMHRSQAEKALHQLVAAGRLESRIGSGFYVRADQPIDPDILELLDAISAYGALVRQLTEPGPGPVEALIGAESRLLGAACIVAKRLDGN